MLYQNYKQYQQFEEAQTTNIAYNIAKAVLHIAARYSVVANVLSCYSDLIGITIVEADLVASIWIAQEAATRETWTSLLAMA